MKRHTVHTWETWVSRASLLSWRFSCSRYIGQSRRLSHGFFELFICMRSSACTYLSSLGLSSSPSPPFLTSVDHTLQEAFPLSRPDLAKCRDPRGVSRCNIALLDVCTCLAMIFLSLRLSATFSRCSSNIFLFVSDYIKFYCLFYQLEVFILMTDFFNQSYIEHLANVN